MLVYEVIFTDPFGDPDGGIPCILAHVAAEDVEEAEALCHQAVWDEGGIYEGMVFTMWPEPVKTA